VLNCADTEFLCRDAGTAHLLARLPDGTSRTSGPLVARLAGLLPEIWIGA
jgi:hypothetical protein